MTEENIGSERYPLYSADEVEQVDAETVRLLRENSKPTNPKDRVAISKLDLSLIPASALIQCALAMTEGDLKYAAYNWRSAGALASVYQGGLERHLFKWQNGQDVDAKTLVHHLGYVMANAAILIDALAHGVLTDDRPPKQDVTNQLDRAEEIVRHLQELFKNGPPRHTQLDNPSEEDT